MTARQLSYPAIPARQAVQAEIAVTPRARGRADLVVVFNAAELFDVSGSVEITVT